MGVRALRDAIVQLGNVFRQFASVQKRAIDARGATERMRGLFLASMSHDLKGPLNAILGFAELVQRSDLAPPQRESIAIIEQRGRELLVLVQTILDSARIEAGQLHLERGWTTVGDVVMAAVLDTRELADESVDIQAEIQPGVPKVYGDAPRLVSALVAIVTSSMHLVREGRIVLRATIPSEGDRLRIDVEVLGRSTIPEEREKIFERGVS
jgi:signal transduction histidine kinase